LTSSIEDVVWGARVWDVECFMAGSYVMLLVVKESRENKEEADKDAETMAD